MQCYRCGASLAALSLPLSRQDLCPECTVYLHCCRMCVYFDPAVAEQCREDDAEEVKNKEIANFCDYFRPDPAAHDPRYVGEEANARSQLDAIFGDGERDDADEGDNGPDDHQRAAEDLFK